MSDFPLFKGKNGQWRKDVWDSKLKRSIPYYFGSIETDPKGEAALREWVERKDAIKAGLDKLRTGKAQAGDITLNELLAKYLAAMKTRLTASEVSLPHYRNMLAETQWLSVRVGGGAVVNAMQPSDFGTLASLLISGDAERGPQGTHARKRIIAMVKAIFNWGAGNGLHKPLTFGTEFSAPDTSPEAIRKAKYKAGTRDHSERIVTGAEMDKLLDRAQAQFKAILLLSANTGLGPADLGRLRWWQLNLETGYCPQLPRGKTGNNRAGYLWKKTRKALRRVATLKHNAAAIAKDGQDALVFISRKGLAMYREAEIIQGGKSVGVKIDNAISGTVSKMAREVGLDGVTQYRLRHTFKTLGKRARDPETLNYMMGHADRSTGKTYDHTTVSPKAVRRVARIVYGRLWPKPKAESTSPLRIADASREEVA